MQLDKIAKARDNAKHPNHSILVYGSPKTGKTELVGTAAKISEVKRIVWFDLENGAETLLHMGLTDTEMAKIDLIRIPDTRQIPRAIETILKCLTIIKDHVICEQHGKIECVQCKVDNKFTGTVFNLSKMTHDDLLVIDSGSQLGDSALALACIGKDVTYKPGYDEWGAMGKYLADICTVIQASEFTNTVMISHLLPIEEEVNGIKRDKFFPLVGTKPFSMRVGKFFGTVILTEIKLRKHRAGSSSTYKQDYLTGSRVNAKLDDEPLPDMRKILIEGGILK